MDLNENNEKKIESKNPGNNKNDIRGMIKDLFSNDFLNDDVTNFSKTKYDKGNKYEIFLIPFRSFFED